MSIAKRFTAASVAPPAELQRDLDAITKNPDDFDAIIAYGATQVAALNTLATRMIQAQGKFNDAVSDMAAAQQTLIDGMTGAGIGMASPGLAGKLRAMADTVVAAEAAKNEAEDLGRERAQITHDLKHFRDAGPAVQEEYRNRHIPGAATPEDKAQVKRRADDFTDRLAIIEACYATSRITASQVSMLIDSMSDMIDRMKPILAGTKDIYENAKLDYEEKEAAKRLSAAIKAFAKGTTEPVTVKKPLQFKPKP